MGLHLPSTLNSPVQPVSYMMPTGMHHLQGYPSPPGHMPGMLGGGGGHAGHQQQRGGGGGGRGVQYVYHLNNAQVGGGMLYSKAVLETTCASAVGVCVAPWLGLFAVLVSSAWVGKPLSGRRP